MSRRCAPIHRYDPVRPPCRDARFRPARCLGGRPRAPGDRDPRAPTRPDLRRLRAQCDRGARRRALPRRGLAGAARADGVAADRHRRARVGARQPLLHGRPLRPRGAADPVARRRRLPPLPGARRSRRLRPRAGPHPRRADDALDRRRDRRPGGHRGQRRDHLPDRVRQHQRQAGRGRDDARLPGRRSHPDRRGRRLAVGHGLAPGPHVGAARRRHRDLLARRLDVPRGVTAGHAAAAGVVRHLLDARPADRGARLVAARHGPAPGRARRPALHLRPARIWRRRSGDADLRLPRRPQPARGGAVRARARRRDGAADADLPRQRHDPARVAGRGD